MARLFTLFRLYKKNGIIKTLPEQKKLAVIKRKIQVNPKIKISTWKMSEKTSQL